MASKTKTTIAYAYVLYTGVMKGGYTYVDVTEQHPETELLETIEQFYGDIGDVKGRYVKCLRPLTEVHAEIIEALAEFKYGKKSKLYKCNMEDVLKVLKSVTGVTKASTIGVYNNKKHDADADTEVVPKKNIKKTKQSVDEEEEIEAKPAAKKTSKKTTKVEEETVDIDEEEIEAKPAAKKTAPKKTKPVEDEEEEEIKIAPKKTTSKPKPAPKGKSVVELDQELEDDEVIIQTKGKTTGKTGSKAQVIIESDNEQEEDN
jgi:hypothetical protein